MIKRTRRCNFLFGSGSVIQIHTGHTLQLPHRAVEHYRPAAPHGRLIDLHKILHGVHPGLDQLRRNAPPSKPRPPVWPPAAPAFVIRQASQIAHLRKMRRVTARLALGGFCDVVCRLGQCLGRLDANATRNTDPAKDVGSHLVAALYQVARYASQVDKALGDRINFLPVPQTCFTQFPI